MEEENTLFLVAVLLLIIIVSIVVFSPFSEERDPKEDMSDLIDDKVTSSLSIPELKPRKLSSGSWFYSWEIDNTTIQSVLKYNENKSGIRTFSLRIISSLKGNLTSQKALQFSEKFLNLGDAIEWSYDTGVHGNSTFQYQKAKWDENNGRSELNVATRMGTHRRKTVVMFCFKPSESSNYNKACFK